MAAVGEVEKAVAARGAAASGEGMEVERKGEWTAVQVKEVVQVVAKMAGAKEEVVRGRVAEVKARAVAVMVMVEVG